jgi:hypothetical protein
MLIAMHKKILEWQAAHPNITWIGWALFGRSSFDFVLAAQERIGSSDLFLGRSRALRVIEASQTTTALRDGTSPH